MIPTAEALGATEPQVAWEPRDAARAIRGRPPAALAGAHALQRRLAEALAEVPAAADLAVERILIGHDALDASYLERGARAARAVCALRALDGGGADAGATGFLVSPRCVVVPHAFVSSPDAARGVVARFGHHLAGDGHTPPLEFALDPEALCVPLPAEGVTIVAMRERTADGGSTTRALGALPLADRDMLALPGEWLSTIHHPRGGARQLALRQTLVIARRADGIWHRSRSITPGTGAPLFNDAWQVVAVQRAGVPARDARGSIITVHGAAWHEAMDESEIVWSAGIGTPAHAVVAALHRACGDHPLVREVMTGATRDAGELFDAPAAPSPPAPVVRPPTDTGYSRDAAPAGAARRG